MSQLPVAVATRDWPSFARELADFLYDAPGRTVLILETTGNRFAQFSRESEVLHAEVVGNEYLDPDHRLDAMDEEELAGAGWELEEHGNWARSTRVTHADFVAVTVAVVDALRDVLGVARVEDLDWQGFVECRGRTVDFGRLGLGLHALPWCDDEVAPLPDPEVRAEVEGAAWLAEIRRDIAHHQLTASGMPPVVRRLREELSPAAALSALGDLAVCWALATRAPWRQLPAQVRALAKAAGASEFDAQRTVLERLLTVPSTRDTTLPVWQAWRPTLVEMAHRSRRVRGVLLRMRPRAKDLDAWWLELLRDAGAWQPLIGEDEHGVLGRESRAGWLAATVAHPDHWETADFRGGPRALWPAVLVELVAAMAPALVADDEPVRLHCSRRAGRRTWNTVIDLRVLEACLSRGVPVAEPPDTLDIELDLWLRQRDPEDGLTAVTADPVFGKVVEQVVAERTDTTGLSRIPALRRFLPDRSTYFEEIDDASAIATALDGFAWETGVGGGLLRAVETTSDLLRGRPVDDESGDRHMLGSRHWHPLIAGIGVAALRAVSPVIGDRDRRHLIALLEVWSTTVFADTDARLRIGLVETDQVVVRSDTGVSVVVGPPDPPSGLRRFVDFATGSSAPPEIGAVRKVTAAAARWGTTRQLRDLIGLLAERGPVPWDSAAPQVLSDRTGLSYAASALALSGHLGWYLYGKKIDDLVDTPLGLGRRELEDAGKELADRNRRLGVPEILADVLPVHVEELWEPGAMRTLAERLASAWNSRHGSHAPASEQDIAAVIPLRREFDEWLGHSSAADICSALLAPERCDLLVRPLDTPFAFDSAGDVDRAYAFLGSARVLVQACRWAYAFRPVGDPLRAGVPAVVRLLRTRMLEYRARESYLSLDRERRWLASMHSAAMVARITAQTTGTGYEADPLFSAPDLVREVSEHLNGDIDAARLYLQLVTIARPTDRDVRQWNSWTTKYHADVQERLLATGRVVRETRSGAGRTLFPPGPWHSPGLEDYKWSLHEISYDSQVPRRGFHAPPRPLPDLFAEAWKKFL